MAAAGTERYGTASAEDRARPAWNSCAAWSTAPAPQHHGADPALRRRGGVGRRVVVTALPTAEQLNPEGTVHGGLAATLLDSCMGLAVRTLTGAGPARRRWSSRSPSSGRPPRPAWWWRRRGAQHGPPRRLGRGPADRPRWQVAGARHDDLPGFEVSDADGDPSRDADVTTGRHDQRDLGLVDAVCFLALGDVFAR